MVLGVDSNNPKEFAYTKVMKDLITEQPGFNGFTSTREFWSYVGGDLLETLYDNREGYLLKENKVR